MVAEIALTCLLLTCPVQKDVASPVVRRDIDMVIQQGAGTAKGRAAWLRLSRGGPELLAALLLAMDTPDVVASNWLRTAFDQVLDRALTTSPQKINVQALLDFARDPRRQGRARRLALAVVERLRPGTTAKLLPTWLEDAEFRFDAVDRLLDHARKLATQGAKDTAETEYRQALASSRDVDQARRAAVGLLDLGIKVSVARHLGFLTDWYVIGPFDAANKTGFTTVYPPEKNVVLGAALPGKMGKVQWKRYQVSEPSPRVPGRHVALVDLREARALGDADDAVAFAYTEITVSEAQQVEFRGAADDNFIIWVNGAKVFGFEEYNNGVRHDRHRFPVQLRKGKNTILVKICQSPPYIAPNWEFFLRIVDRTGRAVSFESALPPK
jgi:hypothetical protein